MVGADERRPEKPRSVTATPGHVALRLAFEKPVQDGANPAMPLPEAIAAARVGIVEGKPLLHPTHHEDAAAGVGLNVAVMESEGPAEVQPTAEDGPFGQDALDAMPSPAEADIGRPVAAPKRAVEAAGGDE